MIKLKKLNDKNEIDRVFDKGEVLNSPFFVCYIIHGPEIIEETEYLVIASKKVGGAVKRNRAKRLLRAVLFNNVERLRLNSIIMIAKYMTVTKKSTELVTLLVEMLDKIRK